MIFVKLFELKQEKGLKMFVLGSFLRILLFPLLTWTGMVIKWRPRIVIKLQNISKTTGKFTGNIDIMPLILCKSN